MYVAVKGGEKAIDNAHSWMSEIRRGDPSVQMFPKPNYRTAYTWSR